MRIGPMPLGISMSTPSVPTTSSLVIYGRCVRELTLISLAVFVNEQGAEHWSCRLNIALYRRYGLRPCAMQQIVVVEGFRRSDHLLSASLLVQRLNAWMIARGHTRRHANGGSRVRMRWPPERGLGPSKTLTPRPATLPGARRNRFQRQRVWFEPPCGGPHQVWRGHRGVRASTPHR